MEKRTAKTKPNTTLLFLLLGLLFACPLYASDLKDFKVTLSVKNEKLEQVFKLIEAQVPLKFVYNASFIGSQPPVSIEVNKETLDKVLASLVKPFKGTVHLDGNNVLINAPHIETKQGSPLDEPETLSGKIVNVYGAAIAHATVYLKQSKTFAETDENGNFILLLQFDPDVLTASHIGYLDTAMAVKKGNKNLLQVSLSENVGSLQEVIVNTGYQTIPKERATGSFEVIDNKLFNRSVTTNVLNHIENVVPGILFNHGDAGNTDAILIRGRGSIFSSVSPLIVLDNFPYDGDISNINPNDVESVTMLKDAAAASIWGARAGNGVIVITTKKGKLGKPQVEFNSNISFIAKPDLFSTRALNSSDYIELEKYLYAQGYYSAALSDPSNPPVTPVVELLNAVDNGTMSSASANSQIEAYKQYDVRNDLQKYFYRTAVNQQHALSVSGATSALNYFMSAGWDNNLGVGNLVGSQYNRITLRTQNTFKVTNSLQIDAGMSFFQNNNQSGNNPGYSISGLYPYAQLVSNNGVGLNLDNSYRKGFTDTAGDGNLLSWKYNPLNDIGYTTNTTKIRDYLLNVGVRYRITDNLTAEIKYQYENSVTTYGSLYTDSSFYTRNLINSFYQPSTNSFPIPIGGINDLQTSEMTSNQGRAQLNYNRHFGLKHELTALAGYEVKNLVSTSNEYRLYGYKDNRSIVNSQIDFVDYFQQFNNPNNSSQIPNPQFISSTLDRFLSYYGNAAYTYENRYTISASTRNDAANLFGVSTNQKGVPLWSAGASWQLNNEKFYHFSALPFLKLRATYGYNGNFSRVTSALTTVTFGTSRFTPLTTATIQNPPDADLRWEKVRMLNLGIDFESKNKVLSGSFEYYNKYATDLIAPALQDPTLGLTQGASANSTVYKNVADMKGHGFDITLNSKNIDGAFKWHTNLIFSYAFTEVTKYLVPAPTNGSSYLNSYQTINPVVGKSIYAIYSYRWAGLDPATGDPMGYIGKTPTKDYVALSSQSLDSTMRYNGPAQPPYFGAMRNTFSYKQFSLSFNISYKFGYYFLKNSVNYGTLFNGWYWNGSADYTKRWQKPGDEKYTNVPSVSYPANGLRDNFYMFSEILVKRADNIRLEDIRIDYALDKTHLHALPFKQVNFYMYASNLGTLWVANKDGIDPYYNNSPKLGESIAFGLNVSF